jgi:2-hydroxychromene-2-carboxylate isomerase
MAAPLDFYFDFSSFYGYFASTKIEALAAKYGRTVNWRPFLLGAAYKVDHELEPLTLPMKGAYIERDIARSARFYGIPYKYPSRFPIPGVAPGRAFYWVNERDPALAKQLALALYQAYFVQDRDISRQEITADVAATLGLKHDEVLAALNDVAVKTRFREAVDAAIKRGVFGSPYVIVDGEPFWGVDRFDQIERWLAHGPF